LVEIIRELCEKQGKTLFSLEKECGFGNGTINKWDKNSPSVSRALAVAKALNTTVSYLIGETDIKNPASETETGKVPTIQDWKEFLATFSKDELKAVIDMATSELIGRE